MCRRKCECDKCDKCDKYDEKPVMGDKKCCCNFNMLVILILVILQFGKKEKGKDEVVDNSILFIITLFYLSCCIKC